MGVIATLLAPEVVRQRLLHCILLSLLASMIVLVAMGVTLVEGWICIAMMSPISLVMAMVGGALGYAIARGIDSRGKRLLSLPVLLLMPLLMLGIEQLLPVNDEVTRVSTSIDIAATPETLWPRVVRVSEIKDGERKPRAAYMLGIPRPVEATLDYDGVGAQRRGRFDNGLVFNETVFVWEPQRRVAFTIKPDAGTLYAPWDQIGARYLDVRQAEYVLEPITGGTRVWLHTDVRVTTRFNGVATLWARIFTRDFLSELLEILKARAEAV